MKTKAIYLLIGALLTALLPLQGQSFNSLKADSLFTILANHNKTMGSLSILENGTPIYNHAVGYASLESDTTASNIRTKYRIGSISKMFTAVLIFQMIDEGKLSLSTRLDTYFPTVPNASTITLQHLLSHRSGIHNFTNDPEYLKYQDDSKTMDEMIAIISACKPDFAPGEKMMYSNSNFVLLGYILEKISRKPYNVLLQSKICSRIGLSDTYYGGTTDLTRNECYSYRYTNKWDKVPETNMSIPHGAGAIVSTPMDLTKFITALFDGKLVSESSLNQMKSLSDGMGMGLTQVIFDGKMAYGHGGSIDGFNSLLCYFPENRVALAYCANGSMFPVNEIVHKAYNIYIGKQEALPDFTPFKVNPDELDQYCGVYSSDQIPIPITITREKESLKGQGKDQPPFFLEPKAKHVFVFTPAGIEMTFIPENNQMTLKQGGKDYLFIKEAKNN